ncbi:MAG: tripartite tricarboxylate transporter substrate binding protein [Betaproteobacteria bacterium]|nr:tripartite tricarboxylate transporter substrate binding protein [Betaproteobacteria bacterium]
MLAMLPTRRASQKRIKAWLVKIDCVIFAILAQKQETKLNITSQTPTLPSTQISNSRSVYLLVGLLVSWLVRLKGTWLLPLVLFAAPALIPKAWAQAYPTRTITLVCPFAPGGSADIMARLIAQKLGEGLNVPVVVENRPGAGGMVGANFVAKAKPDGYTLLQITGAYPAASALASAPQFDAVKDMTMVSLITSYPFIINVPPNAPFQTFTEFLSFARANPGKLNYSSSGIGSIGHLSAELMNALGNIETVHIPTKGGTTALSELLAGRVDFMFEAPTLSLSYIKSGKLKALASTGKERYKPMQDLPAVAETLAGYETISFIGVGAPAGTPDAIVQQLNNEIRKFVAQTDTAKRLTELGGEPQTSTPEEMNRFVANEFRKWRQVITQRKIDRQ